MTWGEARVYFHDEAGTLKHLPACWTDAVPHDPFVVIAAGRAHLRLDDLRQLRELLDRLALAAEASPCVK